MEPSTVTGIAAGVEAVGSLVSGVAQSAKAHQAASVDRANAQIAENQADSEAAAIRERARRLAGQNRAAAGASGVDITGSFADALDDSAINAELDAMTSEYEGKMQSRNYRSQAAAEDSAASGALVGGAFSAGTQALSGYGNWQLLKAKGF
jgi:hypothetical protein